MKSGKMVIYGNMGQTFTGFNLFSLASGGTIYVRDPRQLVDEQQLNGGEIVSLEGKDWEMILPFLRENERLFGISIEEDVLTVNGERKKSLEIYRKVSPRKTSHIDDHGLEEWGR